MSNFICPHCGMTNIDCGEQGYKTAKEIELGKQIEEIKSKVIEAKNCLTIANADETDCETHFENIDKAEEILKEILK